MSEITFIGQLLTRLTLCAADIIPPSSQLTLQRRPLTAWNATNTPRQRYEDIEYRRVMLGL
jgi:hypothetical protein